MSNYNVDYNDERFTQVENDKKEALSEVEKTYGGMINESDKYYQAQIDATKDYAETQKKNQQAQTDFAIEQIEQQKAQAKKDYTKEQSGAYVDWQKASNQYGATAEQQAASGLTGTGFSESSQVAMYNQYQNRVASARESYTRAVLNYDNAIKDARLQNNSALAEIAYQALQQQLELSLQGFQYKNQLIVEKANQKRTIDQNYYQRYLAVLDQINKENALAEEVRQFNAQMAFSREQFEYQKQKDAAAASGGGGGGGGSGSINKSSSESSGSGLVKKEEPSLKKVESSSSSKATPDMNSVLALGYGPISAARLNELVASGQVRETEKNGKLYYTKVFVR